MAKRINKSDIVGGKLFDDLQEEIKATKKEIDLLTEALEGFGKAKDGIKKSASKLKGEVSGIDVNDVKNLKDFTAKQKEVNKLILDQQRIEAGNLRLKRQKEIAQEREAKAQAKLNKQLEDEANAYKQLEKETRKLKNESKQLGAQLIQLEKEGGKNTKEFKDLEKQYRETTRAAQQGDRQLKELDETVGDNFRNVGNYKDALSGLNTSFLSLGGALTGGAIIGGLFNFNKELSQSSATAQTLFETNKKGGDEIAKTATLIAKSWDKDVNEVLSAANVLTEEFGISSDEAFDRITQGFEKGADVQGEFIDGIKEYSTQLRLAGLSADESIAIITQTQQAGVFSDKGIDAIKEATIRLREMTPATVDALSAVGLSAEQIQRDIASGAKSYFDVIQEVSKSTKEFGEGSQQAGMILADVFGGAGEDAGKFIFEMDELNKSLEDMEDTNLGLSGAVSNLTEKFYEFIFGINEAGGVGEKFATVINFLADNLGTILSVLGRVLFAFTAWKVATSDVTKNITKLGRELLKSTGSFKQFGKALKDGIKGSNGLSKALKGIGFGIAINLALELAMAFYDVASSAAEARRQQDLLDRQIKAANAASNATNNLIQKRLKLREQELQLQLAKGDISQQEFNELLKEENLRYQESIDLKRQDLKTSIESGKAKRAELEKQIKLDENLLKIIKERVNESPKTGSIVGAEEDVEKYYNLTRAIRENKIALERSSFEYEGQRQLLNGLNDIFTNIDDTIHDYTVNIADNSRNARENAKAVKEQSKAYKDLTEEILRLEEVERTRIEEANAFELESIQRANDMLIAEEIRRAELTGEVNSKRIVDALEEERQFRKELARLRLVDSIDAAKGEEDVALAQQRFNQEIERIDNEFTEKKKQSLQDLTNAQGQYADSIAETTESEKEEFESRSKYIELTTDLLEKNIDKRIDLLNKEIEAQKNRQDTLRELANNGNIDAKESIAEAERLEREAIIEKQQLERRKQLIELASTFLISYNNKLEEGKPTGQALTEALSEKAVIESIINSLPAFYDGTEDTGTVNNPLDKNGGRLAVLHDNERVMTKKQNEHLKGLSNEEVVALVQRGKMNEVGESINSFSNISMMSELNGLNKNVKELIKVTKDKPEITAEVKRTIQDVFLLTTKVKKGKDINYNKLRSKS